jgi:hypothetical protein
VVNVGHVRRLSICIPTHHGRAPLLRQLLETIDAEPAVGEGAVEVCISDNASSDGTGALVDEYRARWGDAIVYQRNDEDVGLGPNLLRVVELAHADFCWLLASDDLLVPGAITRVLELLARAPGVTGVGLQATFTTLDLSSTVPQFLPLRFPAWRTTMEYVGFEHVVESCGWLFTFLSSNIVRRAVWIDVVREHRAAVLAREPWPQVVALTEVARRAPHWLWYPRSLVVARSGQQFVLEEEETTNRRAWSDVLPELAITLADTWAGIVPPGLRDAFVAGSLELFANPEHVSTIRSTPGHRRVDDLRVLSSLARRFGRMPYFWRRVVPAFLRPLPAVARVRTPSEPLAPTACVTRVHLSPPDTFTPGEVIHLRSVVINLGPRTLDPAMPLPVHVGSRWYAPDGSVVAVGSRSELVRALPSQTAFTCVVQLAAPFEPGEYELRVAPVQEHVVWFDEIDPMNGWRGPVRVVDVEVGAVQC